MFHDKAHKKSTRRTAFVALLLLYTKLALLFVLLLSAAGCNNDKADSGVSSVVESTDTQIQSILDQPGRLAWKSYQPGTCLSLSEYLHESFAFSGLGQEYRKKPVLLQSKAACKKLLQNDPENLRLQINLITARKQLHEYTKREQLESEKVEEIINRGIDKGIEDARLLMGMMVGGKYFTPESSEQEILLPLLKSNNPTILATTGVVLQIKGTARYKSINLITAHKYLPSRLFEEAKALNNLIDRNAILGLQRRHGFNLKLAALAFQRAWDINKDTLAGYELGCAYMDGKGVKKDVAKALDLLHYVVERGAPAGHFEVGLFYAKLNPIGKKIKGFQQNDKKAMDYFEQAVKNGDVIAKRSLIRNYLDDTSPFYNKERGTSLYCSLPEKIRPKRTILSHQPIKIKCNSINLE